MQSIKIVLSRTLLDDFEPVQEKKVKFFARSLHSDNFFWKFYSAWQLPKNQYCKFPGRYNITTDECGTFKGFYSCECGSTRKFIYRTCKKLDCPICYQQGINIHARKITERFIKAQRTFLRLGKKFHYKHISFNINGPDWQINNEQDYLSKKAKLIRILRKYDLSGLLIYHPYRPTEDEPYKARHSPHFHFIGMGFVPPTKFFKRTHEFGYRNMKNKRTGKYKLENKGDIFRAVRYVLSHAGYFKDRHINTWFNKFSYNKLKKINIEKYWVDVMCDDCFSKVYKVVGTPIIMHGNWETGIYAEYSEPLFLDMEQHLKQHVELYDLEFIG